jgi:hypothetical protein
LDTQQTPPYLLADHQLQMATSLSLILSTNPFRGG